MEDDQERVDDVGELISKTYLKHKLQKIGSNCQRFPRMLELCPINVDENVKNRFNANSMLNHLIGENVVDVQHILNAIAVHARYRYLWGNV